MMMNYPGLPLVWGQLVGFLMAIVVIKAMLYPLPSAQIAGQKMNRVFRLGQLPLVGRYLHRIFTGIWPLLALRLLMVTAFVLIIVAGLHGSQIPQRNIATLFTWNIWWTGVIISIFFIGTAWCAVCPWNALANWLVNLRLWGRSVDDRKLNLRVPRWLRNIWPALLLFIGLSWLELGIGITTNPYATALMALLMVVLATLSLALFQRNAFCRYFCPVGRTIGSYSQLAAIELRPINDDICQHCETLDCYHGNANVDPCPTWLVMGRIQQNSYCTSCGNCSQSCPQQNIDWRWRQPAGEAVNGSRPHWDEAWFMLGLLALTGFHGITMMPFWHKAISQLARLIGDSGQLLWSFSIGLAMTLLLVSGFYAITVMLTHRMTRSRMAYRRTFATLAFVSLPLAFAYHVAHNLTHLVRESGGIVAVLANPFGFNTLPLSMAEMDQRAHQTLISPTLLHAMQAGLIIAGFYFAVQILRYRLVGVAPGQTVCRISLLPMLFFAATMTGFHLWMLLQPMMMRM